MLCRASIEPGPIRKVPKKAQGLPALGSITPIVKRLRANLNLQRNG